MFPLRSWVIVKNLKTVVITKHHVVTVRPLTYMSFSLYLIRRFLRIPASFRSPRRIMSSTPWMEVGCIGLMLVAFWGEIQCSWKWRVFLQTPYFELCCNNKLPGSLLSKMTDKVQLQESQVGCFKHFGEIRRQLTPSLVSHHMIIVISDTLWHSYMEARVLWEQQHFIHDSSLFFVSKRFHMSFVACLKLWGLIWHLSYSLN